MPAESYIIHEKVGQGVQGTVYRATHTPTGDTVAVKKIDVSCLDEKQLQIALREIQVLATVKDEPHPCIAMYRESYVNDDHELCIVLEWCSHGTLQDLVEALRSRNERLTEDAVWSVFLSLASALFHLHSLGILHRDVKMSNVFLQKTNDDAPAVRLGDFGVSCILGDRSRAQTIVGTPYYLSPELCLGKQYDDRTDIWSLGVILFILCNNKMPFEASNYAALILRIVKSQHAKHTGHYCPTLHRMATWCMQKDESDRPTAKQILSHPNCLLHARRLGVHLPREILAIASSLARGVPSSRPATKVSPTAAPSGLPVRKTAKGAIQTTRRVRNPNVQTVKSKPPAGTADIRRVQVLPSFDQDDSDSEREVAGEKDAYENYRRHLHQPTDASSAPEPRSDVTKAILKRYDQVQLKGDVRGKKESVSPTARKDPSPPNVPSPILRETRSESVEDDVLIGSANVGVTWKVDNQIGTSTIGKPEGQQPLEWVNARYVLPMGAEEDEGPLVEGPEEAEEAVGAYEGPRPNELTVEEEEEDTPPHERPPDQTPKPWPRPESSEFPYVEAESSTKTVKTDVTGTPLETITQLSILDARSVELLRAGKDLIGASAFHEILAVLQQTDRVMSGAQLQAFVDARVAPDKVAEVMYLAFRYVFLEGERKRQLSLMEYVEESPEME